MSGREVREYTNLTDPKDRKLGKGKEKIDDEDITFQRMVAKMQEVAGERGGYLHGRGALDSDDLLYLKEQMEAEQDAERLLRRTEKRAFAAFKAAMLADSVPAPVPLPLRVEPKPKSGIRQQDLLKNIIEIKPKRQKVISSSDPIKSASASPDNKVADRKLSSPKQISTEGESKGQNFASSLPSKSSADVTSGSLLGLSYDNSDDDE
ncbi:ankyrin repeat protein isoform X2 [Carex rostrata]